MPGKPRYTPAQVIAALHATKGLVFLAAKRLKCDPDTVLNYCKRYPAVEAAKQAQRGELIDLAEQKLRQSIQKGEAWGISFCLKTLGKERGYVERVEQKVDLLLQIEQAAARVARDYGVSVDEVLAEATVLLTTGSVDASPAPAPRE